MELINDRFYRFTQMPNVIVAWLADTAREPETQGSIDPSKDQSFQKSFITAIVVHKRQCDIG